jgi:hypothetical protein
MKLLSIALFAALYALPAIGQVLDVPELGVEAVSALWKLYPKTFQIDKVDRLLLNHTVLDQIKSGEDPRKIAEGWQTELSAFKAVRSKYLLYK